MKLFRPSLRSSRFVYLVCLCPCLTHSCFPGQVEVKKQVMEDAVMQRKRSSRLAMKESLREAERVESKRRMELGKEMERHRRWEARVKREEEEKLKLESMRSARLKEKAGIFSNAYVGLYSFLDWVYSGSMQTMGSVCGTLLKGRSRRGLQMGQRKVNLP